MQQKWHASVLEETNLKIMKFKFYKTGLLLTFFLGLQQLGAQTTINTIISANDTWTAAGNPYILAANSAIQKGVTVRIEPGVIIKSPSKSTLYVDGELIVNGNKDSVVRFDTCVIEFTSNAVGYDFGTKKGSHFNYTYFAGMGSGLIYTIKKPAMNLLVQNSMFYNGYYSIYEVGSSNFKDTIRIENTKFIGIDYGQGYAVYFGGTTSNLEMDECLIKNSYGMYLPNKVTITRSTFYNIATWSGLRINAYGNPGYTTEVTLSCNTFRKFKGNIIDMYGLSKGNTVIINNNTFDSAEIFLNLYMLYRTKPYNLYIYQNNFLYASKNAITIAGGNAPTTPDTLDFNDNYWGTTNTADIANKVYDYTDNIVQPVLVDYHSYLSNMVTDCTAGDTQSTHQVTMVKEMAATEFDIMPNPANDVLNITTPLVATSQVVIRDITGALVLQTKFTSNAGRVDLSPLGSGIYFVTVQSEGRRAETKKVLIQH